MDCFFHSERNSLEIYEKGTKGKYEESEIRYFCTLNHSRECGRVCVVWERERDCLDGENSFCLTEDCEKETCDPSVLPTTPLLPSESRISRVHIYRSDIL